MCLVCVCARKRVIAGVCAGDRADVMKRERERDLEC